MLPAVYNCPLPRGRPRVLTDGSRSQSSTYLNGVADAPGSPTLAAVLFAALIRTAPSRGGGFATGSNTIPTHCRQTLLPRAALDDSLLQQPVPLPPQQPPLPLSGQQLLWPARSITTSTSTSSPGSPSPSPSPGISSPVTSSLSAEALRPRRFSAPVIARLLRTTTSLQALADVVQQQSPYLDIPLVTVALLHLALLYSRGLQQQQLQQQQRPSSPDSTVAPICSITDMNGSRNGNGSSAAVAATAAGGGGGQMSPSTSWATASGGDAEDYGLPLQISSLIDDDDGEEEEEEVKRSYSGVEKEPAGAGTLGGVGPVGRGSAAAAEVQGDSKTGVSDLVAAMAEEEVMILDAAAATAAGGAANPEGRISPLLGVEEGDLLLEGMQIKPGRESRVVAVDRAEEGERNNGSSSSSAGAAVVVPEAPVAAAATMPPPPSPVASALRVLVPMVLADLDGVTGSDLSKVVSALAVLRYDNKVVIEQLLQVLSLKLVECSPQELANVLVSLAMLGVPPDPYVRSNIYTAVRYQIRRFMPRDLALTLWAYGAMGTDVQEDAVLVLLEASKPRLAAFSPLHLAKAAQGLAALRYRPPPEWVAAYCEALRPALRRTASRELCAVLLALADLQVTLDDTTRATLVVHTLTSLPSLAPRELALSLWSLGRLTSTGLPALIDLDTSARVLEVTLVRLRQGVFSGGELQQLLEGLTRLALQPPLEWMQAYVGVLQPKLATLEARQLAGVLGSLAAQQYRPEPQMQRVVMEATQQNMRQLLADTTATASLITALRRLNIEPPPSWVAALLEASRSALKNRATDLHLANLAGALAAWGVRPDGRWAARLMWRSQVLMQQGRMSPRALVALLQAMSALQLRPNPVWMELCLHTAISRAGHPDFEPQHFSTLLPALHALGIQPPQGWLNRLMLAMYRCWDRFSVTHWSSMLPALVLLEAEAPHEWLHRLEDVLAPRLADCSALQLLTLLVALTKLKRMGMEAMQVAATAEPGTAAVAAPATSTSATVNVITAAAAASTKVAAAAALVSGGEVQSGGVAAAEAVAARSVAATASNPTSRPNGAAATDNVTAADTAAGSSSSQLQQRSVGSSGDADDNNGLQPSSPASAASATAPPTAGLSKPSGPADTHDPAAISTTASSSSSSSSMLLSIDRLRNLRTARWRQRRLGELAEAELLPRGGWLAAWWAASVLLLGRVRYAPSELLLTASWLVSLKMRPPSEWLEASIEVSQRYSKVMGPGEQMQLAAALLPLAGRRANLVSTTHKRRTRLQLPPSVQASPSPPAPAAATAATAAAEGAAPGVASGASADGADVPVAGPAVAGRLGTAAEKRSERRRRRGKGGPAAAGPP